MDYGPICVLVLRRTTSPSPKEQQPHGLDGDVDIPKMYLHTENESARLSHSKLAVQAGKNIRKYVSVSKVKVIMSKALNYFERYRNGYSDQAAAVSDQ